MLLLNFPSYLIFLTFYDVIHTYILVFTIFLNNLFRDFTESKYDLRVQHRKPDIAARREMR